MSAQITRLLISLVTGLVLALPAVVVAQPEEAPAAEEASEAVEEEAVEAAEEASEAVEEEVIEAAEEEADGEETADEPAEEAGGFVAGIDAFFSKLVGGMASVMFFKIFGVPFIVGWLFIGAVFFTLRMKFVNFRAFRHAIDVVRGKYDNPSDEGEVSHFQALSSALSATVGLGNIAGVALAVKIGGPGAAFWMIVAALFGMTAKFVECTLGQKYRVIDEQGAVLGGPMRYLEVGLAEKGMGPLGKVLAVMFAVFCIGGSFGGGNMFQANQAVSALTHTTAQWFNIDLPAWLIGLVLMGAVGVVILGGIRRIAATAEKIVPLMCGMYLIAALFVVAVNLPVLPEALGAIISGAFDGNAVEGGVIGVLIIGVQRAAFSNEAGIGSASIAHSAARTDEPVREGIVALLEPFIDTVIVCLATALVIVISGVLDDPAAANVDGAVLTSMAFESAIHWFPLLLTGAIMLFAFSTMISWSYYGERCWTNLFGPKSSMIYRVIFLVFIFIGSVTNLGAVLGFSDLMILSMAFPNILGLYILSSDVKRDLDSYLDKLKSGQFKTYK